MNESKEITKAVREQQIEQHESWYVGIQDQDTAFKLSALEDHIFDAEAKAKSSWITMGWALRKIRDEDLYKPKYATFAEYVEHSLGYKKSWAYEVIDASEVAKTVPITATAQARVLTGLDPEEQADVWQKAEDLAFDAGKRGVTVETLKQAKGEVIPTEDPIPTQPKESEEEEDSPTDGRAFVLEATKTHRQWLREFAAAVKNDMGASEGAHWFDADQFVASLQNAARLLKLAAPEADCPYCEGKGCDSCNHLGWLPKGVYDALPDDMKA